MAIVKFRIRRDTDANWSSVNPILALAEPGLDITNNKVKYGDGVTTWNSLSYSSSGSVAFTDITSKPTTLGGYGITDAQGINANLTAISGLVTAADRVTYWTGSGAASLATFTAAGRALVDDASAADQRTTLGLVAAGAGDIWVEKAGDTMTGTLIITGGDVGLDNTRAYYCKDSGGNFTRVFYISGANVVTFGSADRPISAIVFTANAVTWGTWTSNGLAITGSVKPSSYTVGTAPSAATHGAGAMIYVSNETGGAVIAFSDGTNWRRVTDRTIIA